MAYLHPGKLFINTHGYARNVETVRAYARFLREQAGLAQSDALDFHQLRAHFDVPEPKLAKLPGQQGLLLNSDTGVIVINETDIQPRQRFSEAHEYMEMLFSADDQYTGWAERQTFGSVHLRKEGWCDAGAAELLMPKERVILCLASRSISFETARFLSERFETSIWASLWQMVNACVDRYAVVLWQMGHTKQEQKTVANQAAQQTLFAQPDDDLMPRKKLRVAWRQQNFEDPFIPFNKSIKEPSSVHRAHQERVFTSGSELLELGRDVIRFVAENQPYRCDDEIGVLSLLRVSN